MRVDLNSDLGESFGAWTMGDDAALMGIITSANVACGFHAGDPMVMAATVASAKANGVAIGAHPGFNDLAGFGRRVIRGDSLADIEAMTAYQIGALQALAARGGHRVGHVKTHGALANMAADDGELARAIARAVKAVDSSLILVAMAGTEQERAAEAVGLKCAREVFADRAYTNTGRLVSRSKPGAVLHDPAMVAARALAMVQAGAVTSVDGQVIPVGIDTICVHGDSPGAIAMAAAVKARLQAAGVEISAFAGWV